ARASASAGRGAVGRCGDWRGGDGGGGGGGCGVAGLCGAAAGAGGLWQGDVEPVDQAGAWGCALSRTGQCVAGDGGAEGAGAAAAECAAPGTQPAVCGAELHVVGEPVLRDRDEDL